MEYKYPYIPKDYYAAVMFACKLIRENGQFHRAINASANYYGVNAQELEKHVRARQGAGQKGKRRATYKYYAMAYAVRPDNYSDYDPLLKPDYYKVVKATSKRNAEAQIRDRFSDNRHYAYWAFILRAEEFPTRAGAEMKVKEWVNKE